MNAIDKAEKLIPRLHSNITGVYTGEIVLTIENLIKELKKRDEVIEAAIQVSGFVKNNEYPVMGSTEQNELTTLLNNQDIALKAL